MIYRLTHGREGGCDIQADARKGGVMIYRLTQGRGRVMIYRLAQGRGGG